MQCLSGWAIPNLEDGTRLQFHRLQLPRHRDRDERGGRRSMPPSASQPERPGDGTNGTVSTMTTHDGEGSQTCLHEQETVQERCARPDSWATIVGSAPIRSRHRSLHCATPRSTEGTPDYVRHRRWRSRRCAESLDGQIPSIGHPAAYSRPGSSPSNMGVDPTRRVSSSDVHVCPP